MVPKGGRRWVRVGRGVAGSFWSWTLMLLATVFPRQAVAGWVQHCHGPFCVVWCAAAVWNSPLRLLTSGGP